ncbi:hypothetical protein DFJ77DRAFT_429147 [Powellomyces hirtus]|nr:hypothetical protein DFJ77DRAFT_429147 [Powellomyces hirtus]
MPRASSARARTRSGHHRRDKRRAYSPSGCDDSLATLQLDQQEPSGEHVNEFTSIAAPGRVSRIISTATLRRHTEGTNTTKHSENNTTNGVDQRPRSKREGRSIPPRTPISSVITTRRCFSCKKKIGPATSFKCRCNQVFCSVHRYSDRHSCSFDYRGAGKITLVKENPLIKKEKLEKI